MRRQSGILEVFFCEERESQKADTELMEFLCARYWHTERCCEILRVYERERERFLIVCEEMASDRAEGDLWNLVLIVVCEERRRLRGEWWLRTFG